MSGNDSATTIDIVCLGEAMGQFVPDDGPLEDATTFSLGQAGAESNVAIATARLGVRSAWVSRLGDDAVGERLLKALAEESVDTSAVVRDREHPTGIFLKDPSGLSRKVSYYRKGSAASRMDRGDVDRALALRPAFMHLSGITSALSDNCDDAIEYALESAAALGITTSFDVNYRPVLWSDQNRASARLSALADKSDIVFVGLDEAEILWGAADADAAAAHLSGAGRVVVKNGAESATVHSPAGRWEVPALSVDVVESVGAGDAFAAGWLGGMIHGVDDRMRLRCGHLMARTALTSLSDHGERIAWDALLADAADPAIWVRR